MKYVPSILVYDPDKAKADCASVSYHFPFGFGDGDSGHPSGGDLRRLEEGDSSAEVRLGAVPFQACARFYPLRTQIQGKRLRRQR